MPRSKKHNDQAKDGHKAVDSPMSLTSYRDVLPVTEDLEDRPSLHNWRESVQQHWKKIVYLLLFLLYNVYLGFAIDYGWDQSADWCQGVKLLIIITVITYIGLLYYVIIKPFYGQRISERWLQPFGRRLNYYWEKKLIRWTTFPILITLVVVFYIIDTWKSPKRLVSLCGLASILILGVIFSKDRRKIIWRHVVWGIGIQFMIGLLVLRWPIGAQFFQCVSDKVQSFLANTDAGSTFVFDYLASGNIAFLNATDVNSNLTISLKSIVVESVFAFKVLPVILFFSFFISILYYWGIMQHVVMQLGWLLQISIGTTAAESMNAAASVFVGMTEAPLMIKPYIPLMTKSEIHAVMAGGFATIAGTVFAAYISFGINGAYLLSGAIMSAPAGLAMSKIVFPETEESRTTFRDITISKREERSVLEAAANGALSAVTLAAGIASGLITFIAFITFVDGIINWLASLVGYNINIEWILGKIFIPLAYVMGVDWKDCDEVGYLIGMKTIINEFVAYKKLEQIKGLISHRSEAIATYALCSFANISSVGTQIAVLSAMVPEKKSEFAEVAVRAVCTGAAACFLTACMAGSLMDESGEPYSTNP